MKKSVIFYFAVVLFITVYSMNGFAAEEKTAKAAKAEALAATIAILPFSAKDTSVKDQGSKIADLLRGSLEADGRFSMTKRENLQKILKELQFNDSGLIPRETQNRIGQLTGAEILIAGSVFKMEEKNYVVAKIIVVKTGKVIGCSVSGNGSTSALAKELGKKVAKLLIAKNK
jgi:hypothetical protein